jgi:hypothetical protein
MLPFLARKIDKTQSVFFYSCIETELAMTPEVSGISQLLPSSRPSNLCNSDSSELFTGYQKDK